MILKSINKAWGWTNIKAVEIIDQNDFGNYIFRAEDSSYWRILPENPEFVKIANNSNEYRKLKEDAEFQSDWKMKALVSAGIQKFGKLDEGRKFCLKLPAYVGGEYSYENLGTLPQLEQISFSGDLAQQINDLPDGSKIELKIAE
jgi:hypothetical protein